MTPRAMKRRLEKAIDLNVFQHMPGSGSAAMLHKFCYTVVANAVRVFETEPSILKAFKEYGPPPSEANLLLAQALSKDNGLVIVQPDATQPMDESFSCGLGCWNITLLLRALKATEPAFGPYHFPVHRALYEFVSTKYDRDPRMKGKHTEEDFKRPCVSVVTEQGYFLIDGTNRFLNAYEAGRKHLPMYLIPRFIAKRFEVFYFGNGEPVDHVSLNRDAWGRYTSRDGGVFDTREKSNGE